MKLRRLSLLALPMTVALLAATTAPAWASSAYDAGTQSSLRNLVTAIESWSMFDNNDSYEGVTVAVLADWGWRPSSSVRTKVWVEGDGGAFRASTQDVHTGSDEFVYATANSFNGVTPGSVGRSAPQPGYVPDAAGTDIFDLNASMDVDALALALGGVSLGSLCDATLTYPGTHTARSSVPDHYLACESAAAASGASVRSVLAALAATGGAGALALIATDFVGDGSAPATVPTWDVGPEPRRPAQPLPPSLPPLWRVAKVAATLAAANQVDQATAEVVTRQCLALVAVAYTSTDPYRDCTTLPIFTSGREINEATDHDLDALTTVNPGWAMLNYRARADGGSTKWYAEDAACTNKQPGQACDEYPFFSTEQGGGSATPRPSLKPIDSSQNSYQGNQYSGFLSKCHISATASLPDRAFLAIPIPPVPGAGPGVGLTTQKLCNGK